MTLMATRRTTFSKTQRERAKVAKAEAKRERRASIRAAEPVRVEKTDEQDQVIAQIAALHEQYEGGRMSLDDFVAKRDELLARIVIT